MNLLVTGGCGFIGTNLVRLLLADSLHQVLNLDALSYAGNPQNLADLLLHPRYRFVQGDITDGPLLADLFSEFRPDAVLHLAAESHVDRSIDGPGAFLRTNILGTGTLLQAARTYWDTLTGPDRERFRFVHVSTDEVFGSLGPADAPFREDTPYDPRSPYSASKAASDHLARAWSHTYGLPVIVTNCSNNYGPYQFPEKLIPVVILKALRGDPIPVYGKGENVRDWLHVEDHARALLAVAERGQPGQTYCIGGNNERRNLDLVHDLCTLLDELVPEPRVLRHEFLIQFVRDRPGHDLRYAIDSTKIRRDLGWKPTYANGSGLRQTVQWYLSHRSWWERILSGDYKLERLGAGRGKS